MFFWFFINVFIILIFFVIKLLNMFVFLIIVVKCMIVYLCVLELFNGNLKFLWFIRFLYIFVLLYM